MQKIDRFLKLMNDYGASDFHLTVGRPPRVKERHGDVVDFDGVDAHVWECLGVLRREHVHGGLRCRVAEADDRGLEARWVGRGRGMTTARNGSTTFKMMTAFTFSVTLSRVMTSCAGTS